MWVGNDEYAARTIIISTGAQARMLGLDSERELLGHGVSTCATCDGFFFRGKEIAVVGGGDSAVEEATFLTRFADKVTLIHRRKELRASKIMQDRAFANPKIEFRWNTRRRGGQGQRRGRVARAPRHRDRRAAASCRCRACSSRSATTPTPRCSAASSTSTPTATSLTATGSMQTSVDGVFAAGDVQDRTYRQAITAAGTGCMAALEAERYLEALGDHPAGRVQFALLRKDVLTWPTES